METKQERVWDNFIEVGSIKKNERLKFVVAACTRDGFRCINIREFYYVKRDDAWKPGRDGIIIPLAAPSFKPKKSEPNKIPEMLHPIKDMLEILPKAIEIATDMAIEDANNAVYITKKGGAVSYEDKRVKSE